MRKTVTLLIGAASVAALLAITACKQFLADIEEDFSYWAAEPVITNFRAASPAQTSSAGVLCVSSASDAVLTLTVHNPKNFSFIMPDSSGAPTDIVSFGDGKVKGSGGAKPAYGTDYTLVPISDGKALKLTYTAAFLKANERSSANIGAAITLYSTDGRKFNQTYSFDLEANTPPKLSYVTIGKTAAPINGKRYYVIILKAEDMTETGGTPSGLLHEDITTLAVEGGESAGILFTSGNTAFDVGTGTAENRRLLEAGEVTRLTAADFNGTAVLPDWNQADVNSSWALRYKTNIVVKAASKTYTFRLTDKKGLSSSPVSASTSKTKAQDAQLFDGTTEISGTGESSPYSMNAELSAASVSVTAQTTTGGAKITGKVEKPNDSSWVPRTIDSGSRTSIDISLPAPEANQEALYKITVAAGGDGFDPGTEKVFYVKVTKSSTVTINPADNTTWGGQPSAWDALKATVENGSARVIIVDGIITAPGANKQIKVNRTVKIMGKTGKTNDKLNADDRTFIFDIWTGGNLSLEKLTLQKGKNTSLDGGGAIYCISGKLNTDDVIIEKCTAKNGGGIYAKNVAGPSEIKLTNTEIDSCIANKNGGGVYVGGSGTSFTMTGGKITRCKAEVTSPSSTVGRGGGIYGDNSSVSITIKGTAEISYNESTCQGTGSGGGICGGINSIITVSENAKIQINAAKGFGGGVYFRGTFKFTGGTITGNTITLGPDKLGTGIFPENSGTTLEMSGNARVANDNDIYLPNSRVITITDGPLTGTAPVARITVPDDKYLTSTQVLDGDITDGTPQNYTKFTVTPKIVGGTPQQWTVGGNGYLKQSRYTDVPYGQLEAYLANASATEVNYIEVTGIPPADLKGNTFVTPPDPGALGQKIKNNSSKKVALKLPSGLSVTDMSACFSECTNLVSLENFPSDVTDMRACFYGCENLTTVPAIPASVTDIQECFRYCKKLTTGPDIPSGVFNMTSCFQGCEKLERVKLNCNYNSFNFGSAFRYCDALEDNGIRVPSAQLTTYQTNAGSMGTTSNKFAGF